MDYDWNEYQEWTATKIRTERSKQEALEEWSLGLIGETGEVVDQIKKEKFHGRPLDKHQLLSEVGDCLFYTARILDEYEILLFSPATCSSPETEHELLLSLALRSARFAGEGVALGRRFEEGTAEESKGTFRRTALRFLDTLTSLATLRGITLEEAADDNRRKLDARHPNGNDHAHAAKVKENNDQPLAESCKELYEVLDKIKELIGSEHEL